MYLALSLIIYGFIYTPLKKVSSIAVFVGAIPGALPPLLGYVAATNELNHYALWLFMVQFFWQFPHFWAIGWFLFEDYEKAGFFMLPTGKKDTKTATQIILYTLWLILTSLIPYLGYTGKLQISLPAAILVFLSGVWMLIYAVKLYQTRTPKAARTLMLVSVSYLTLLQIIYIVDKFLR
jgi:protoheme IX farnesyltransferase